MFTRPKRNKTKKNFYLKNTLKYVYNCELLVFVPAFAILKTPRES